MFTRKKQILAVSLIIMMVSLSCSIPVLTDTKAAVSTMVAATIAAQQLPTKEPELSQPTVETSPIPEVVPTSIPPVKRHPDELRVAFIGPDRNIYSWTQSRGAVKILDIGDATDLKISEDGQFIAVARRNENQETSIWMVGFDGSNAREVMNWTDLSTLKTSPDSLGTDPNNLQWLPGTHLLSFSTREVFEGPGMALNDDLIVVDAESGAWNLRLKPGEAGLVTYSPDGQWMAVSTAEKITIMDTDGNPAPTEPLQFSPVITYSEYRYYPSVQWASDSSRIAVVIPATDPLAEPRQPASIWMMNVKEGNPVLQAQVVPQFIGPVSVSPDLAKIFYVKEVGAKEANKREIRTALINGQNDRSVFSGGIPITHDWNPNSEVFAFQTDSNSPVTLSQMNGSVGDLPDTKNIEYFKWIDSQNYLVVRINGGNEEIVLGKWGGGSFAIAALPKSDMNRIQVDFTR